jgi:hypothetical protein
MNCPYCGSEMDWDDYFGRVLAHQDGQVFGDIYRCPKGFAQDGSCESEEFKSSGTFYTFRDNEGVIHEGYPV